MIIYKITNMVTGQSYVGSTTKPLATRMAGHRAASVRGLTHPLAAAIRAYGWDSFEATVLGHAATKDERREMERSAISLFKALAPHGYNLSADGAGGYERTLEQRQKQAAARRGKKLGPMSATGRANQSAARTSAKNWRARSVEYHGVTYACIKDACAATGLSTNQFYRRLKAGLAKYLTPERSGYAWGKWNTGKRHSAEARAKMSTARKGGKNWNARRVLIDGVEYASQVDAQQALGLTKTKLATRIRNGTARLLSAARFVT